MSGEAWLDTGNCGECRRKQYCKAKCKNAQEREEENALRLQLMFMLARNFRSNITDEASMKKELRETEKAVVGRDADEEEIVAAYKACYDLAVHSKFTVYAVVSVLCANCHIEKIPLEEGLKMVERRLREMEASIK